MNKKEFDDMAERLRKEIDYEICYIYGAFVPREEHSVLSKMKSNIYVADRDFLEKDSDGVIFPYDVLRDNVSKCIEDFYDEFSLSAETLYKLSAYGTRAEMLKKQFVEKLDVSKNRMKEEVLKGIESQVMQDNDAKTVMRHIHTILDKRVTSLDKLLQECAGQMKRYMLLWDYENNGYNHYRLVTYGDNCKDCNVLSSEIFKIDQATEGENFPPLHPNCDCRVEILDNEGNVVFVIEEEDIQNDNNLNYLSTSFKQIFLGNYTDDVTALGTLGQILLGLIGLDLPADIRDLIYDVTHWENSSGHYIQTLLDAVALIPVIGSLKYTDEGIAIAKGAAKNVDNIADVTKSIDENIGTVLKNNAVKHYSVVEYKGTVKIDGKVYDVSRKVYQRNDIDIDYFDRRTGLTNIERMQLGKPPIGSDGNPIQLHHVLQKEAGSVVEIREITHREYYSQLHGLVPNGASFRNNMMLNKQYNNFRYNYWKWRAKQIIGGDNNVN